MSTRRWDPEQYRIYARVQHDLTFNAILRNYSIFDELPPRAQLLDIGCGPGNFTELFKYFSKVKKVVGIDLNSYMLQCAQKNCANPDFFEYKAVDILKTFPTELEGKFDCAFSSLVFHYVDPLKLEHVLDSIQKCLKPGAIFIMSMPDFWSTDRKPNVTDFEDLKANMKNSKWGKFIEDGSQSFFDRCHVFEDCSPEHYVSTALSCRLEVKSMIRHVREVFLTRAEVQEYLGATVSTMVEGMSSDEQKQFYEDTISFIEKDANDQDTLKLAFAMIEFIFIAKQ